MDEKWGTRLEKIKEILSPELMMFGSLSVKQKNDLLLPVIDDVIKDVDLAAGKVHVELFRGIG